MKQILDRLRPWWLPCMAVVGTAGTLALLLLRALLASQLRDPDTGRFGANIPAIAVGVTLLVVLAVMACLAEKPRRDIRSAAAMSLALALLLCGVLVTAFSLWDTVCWLLYAEPPAPASLLMTGLPTAFTVLMLACGLLGGVALIAYGLRILQAGGTHAGMQQYSILLPVLWVWLRLARYLMSYASAIDLSNGCFTFAMLIFELLFLFKLARHAAGVGSVRPGSLLFCAAGAGVFALSAPLWRLWMLLQGDTAAYLSEEMASVPDAAIGLLALVFCWTLAYGFSAPASGAEISGEDFPASSMSPDGSGSQE